MGKEDRNSEEEAEREEEERRKQEELRRQEEKRRKEKCHRQEERRRKEERRGQEEWRRWQEECRKQEEKKKRKRRLLGWFAAGILATVAAPIFIPAVVTAVGFGAGGIVAGSSAATMMSWEAGVTPVFVSVCQSIGATGVISASSSAAVGATVTAGGLTSEILRS